MKKMNIIAAMLVAVIFVVSAMPSAISETEGAELEFTDFYPASLTYHEGEELAVVCRVLNTGTEVIYDASISLNVLDPNGTYVYSFDFDIGEDGFEPGTSQRSHSRFLWQVDENATSGRYTMEADLRWGSELFRRTNFFYVPEEPEQSESEMQITALYPLRVVYQPGDDITCRCRIINNGNESRNFYISMCLFDWNGTMFESAASSVYPLEGGARDAYKFVFRQWEDLELGMYTVEAILWWNDTATSKTASFGIDN
jgi:hypothetical protein